MLFYWMLTGGKRNAFGDRGMEEILHRSLFEDPLPLKELQGTPYEWLEAVLFRCLEKEPERRWPNCGAFCDALENGLRNMG